MLGKGSTKELHLSLLGVLCKMAFLLAKENNKTENGKQLARNPWASQAEPSEEGGKESPSPPGASTQQGLQTARVTIKG